MIIELMINGFRGKQTNFIVKSIKKIEKKTCPCIKILKIFSSKIILIVKILTIHNAVKL